MSGGSSPEYCTPIPDVGHMAGKRVGSHGEWEGDDASRLVPGTPCLVYAGSERIAWRIAFHRGNLYDIARKKEILSLVAY